VDGKILFSGGIHSVWVGEEFLTSTILGGEFIERFSPLEIIDVESCTKIEEELF
jgi:hypothetical protein